MVQKPRAARVLERYDLLVRSRSAWRGQHRARLRHLALMPDHTRTSCTYMSGHIARCVLLVPRTRIVVRKEWLLTRDQNRTAPAPSNKIVCLSNERKTTVGQKIQSLTTGVVTTASPVKNLCVRPGLVPIGQVPAPRNGSLGQMNGNMLPKH